MKLLQYAYDAAIAKWYRYDKIATAYAGQKAESLAKKLADETYEDVKAIAKMIQAEEKNQKLKAETIAELKSLVAAVVKKEQTAQKQEQKKAPQPHYVIVVKWNNPIMGEIEYPCKNYEEAKESFEAAKREVHNGNVSEAHVYDQTDGERCPVMGIMSGKL